MPVYKDTHCNRLAGRVGKEYGKKGKKKKEPVEKKELTPKYKALLLKDQVRRATAKDGIKRRILPSGEVQKLKKKEAKKPKKKIKFIVKAKKEKNPYAMGNEKGYAAFFGVKKPTDSLGLLTALGQVEPNLVNKIMSGVKQPPPTLYADKYGIDDLEDEGGRQRDDLWEQVEEDEDPFDVREVVNRKMRQTVKAWQVLNRDRQFTKSGASTDFHNYFYHRNFRQNYVPSGDGMWS